MMISVPAADSSKMLSLTGPGSTTTTSPSACSSSRSAESKISAISRGAGASKIHLDFALCDMQPPSLDLDELRPSVHGFGTIGRIKAEGCSLSWRIVFVAETNRVASAGLSPVFVFLSKRGKLLLLISSLTRCPRRKTFEVDQRSIVNLYVSPGLMGSGVSCEFR